MAIIRVKDPDLWGQLSQGIGQAGGGALEGWLEGQQEAKQQQHMQQLRQGLGQQYGISPDVLNNLDYKTLQSIATQQIKDVPKQQEAQLKAQLKAQEKEQKELSNIERDYQTLQELEDLYSQTGVLEGLRGKVSKGTQTPAFRELERRIKRLRTSPYLKDKNIDIPDPEQQGFLSSLKNAQEAFIEAYADRFPQGEQQAQQPKDQQQQIAQPAQQLPQELVQPKSVQQRTGLSGQPRSESATGIMPTEQGTSDSDLIRYLTGGLTSAASGAIDYIPNLFNIRGRGRQAALEGWDPEKTDEADQPGLDIESLNIPESMKQTLREAKGELGASVTLPTVKGAAEKILPEGYLTPDSEVQKAANEFIGDVTTIMNPLMAGQGLSNIGKGIVRASKAAGLGNLFKYAAKPLPGGTLIGEGLKLGTLLFYGLDDRVKESVGKKFNASREIGTTTPLEAKTVIDTAQKQLKRARKGGPGTPSYKAAKDTYESMIEHFLGDGALDRFKKDAAGPLSIAEQESAILNALQQANPNAGQMQDFVSGLSETVKEVGGYDSLAGKSISKFGDGLRDLLKNPANTSETYASIYKPATEAYRQIKDGEKVINWIDKVLPTGKYISTRGLLIKGLSYAAAEGVYKPMATVLMAMKKMGTSPALQREYFSMMGAAVKENIPSVIRHANNIEKSLDEMKKEEMKKAIKVERKGLRATVAQRRKR